MKLSEVALLIKALYKITLSIQDSNYTNKKQIIMRKNKHLFPFILLVFLLNNQAYAQRPLDNNEMASTNAPNEELVEKKVERKLTKREKSILAAQHYWKMVDATKNKPREEKNTMSICPLHGNGTKEMILSDNYRAGASDYTTCDEYPFAYQLNYRRYCKVCTKIMAKEAGENMPSMQMATFDRCELHNSPLKGNPDYNGMNMDKNTAPNAPHARQYNFRTYCRICTKIEKYNSK